MEPNGSENPGSKLSRLGYTNQQIPDAISICEVMVKKHMGHIGYKLDAVVITMILRRAEQLKHFLSDLLCGLAHLNSVPIFVSKAFQ
jgi:hypothetical protein